MTERLVSLLVIVSLGALSRRWHRIESKSLTRATLDFFMPPLIFLSILDAGFEPGSLLHPAAACTLVILGSLAIVHAAGRFAGRDLMPHALPIAFMNSGFLAFPVVEALGGKPWLNIALVYDQAMNLVIFTAGLGVIGVAGGARERMKAALLNPLMGAIMAGALWKATGLSCPALLRAALELPARATIPVALFSVGAALAEMKPGGARGIVLGVAARYGLGAGLSALYCLAAGVTGPIASVIVISSTMPSAVLSFLLPARHGVESDYAAGVVVASTVVYPFVLPLALVLARSLA